MNMKNIHHSPTELLNPKFIVDEKGKKTAVVLDIKLYEAFLEEVEDLYLGMLASQALAQEDELVSPEKKAPCNKRTLSAPKIKTKGFKFSRDEANAR
jgi:hypothetical protein